VCQVSASRSAFNISPTKRITRGNLRRSCPGEQVLGEKARNGPWIARHLDAIGVKGDANRQAGAFVPSVIHRVHERLAQRLARVGHESLSLHVVGPLADDLAEQAGEELERLGHLQLDRAAERARLDEVSAGIIAKLREIDAATWKHILRGLGKEQQRRVAGPFGGRWSARVSDSATRRR